MTNGSERKCILIEKQKVIWFSKFTLKLRKAAVSALSKKSINIIISKYIYSLCLYKVDFPGRDCLSSLLLPTPRLKSNE